MQRQHMCIMSYNIIMLPMIKGIAHCKMYHDFTKMISMIMAVNSLYDHDHCFHCAGDLDLWVCSTCLHDIQVSSILPAALSSGS